MRQRHPLTSPGPWQAIAATSEEEASKITFSNTAVKKDASLFTANVGF